MKIPATLFLLSSSSLIVSAPVMAQDLNVSDNQPARVDDIIVTAQRRSQNMQDVPISITALSGDALEKAGSVDFRTIGKLVPSFQTGLQGYSGIGFLRGVGSTAANPGMEPPVAMYVDDVYLPAGPSAVFGFNSISSIEVLKGPQGTLFGRNATGGVIHVKTKEPTGETEVHAEASYGRFDTLGLKFYGSTGLAEGVAFNVSAQYLDQGDGWGTNIANGKDVYFQQSTGVRTRLKIEAGPDSTLLFTGMYNRDKRNQGLALSQRRGLTGFAGFSPDAAGAGFWDATSNADSPVRTEIWLGSLKASHDFGAAELVSITAYQSNHTRLMIDVDATPTDWIRATGSTAGKSFSQELQLLSPDESAISWIVGGFYFWDKSHYFLDLTGVAIPVPQEIRNTQSTSSWSGFAQATFEMLPRTNMTIGLRYTSDTRKLDGQARAGANIFGPFAGSTSFQSMTGRFVLDHHVNDDMMIYAGYNRGFKSGLFNIAAIGVGTAELPDPVEPETLDAYSIGFKADLLDRSLRLNGEAFYYDYRNIQTQNVLPNGSTALLNGGKTRIKGLELEAVWRPVSNLQLSGSLAYLHARYKEFDNGLVFFPQPPNLPIAIPAGCPLTNYPSPGGPAPLAQAACNLAGNEPIQTPPFSSNLSVDYTIPASFGDINLNTSWSHGGNFYWEAGNMPFSKQPTVNEVSASIQWTHPSEYFSVRLWGRNLANEKYFGYAGASTSSNFKYSPAEPRTWGVTLAVSYW